MKVNSLIFLLSISLFSCQNTSIQSDTESDYAIDSVSSDNSDTSKVSPVQMQSKLALAANALQVVRQPSGSTTELAVGMEMDQLLGIVSKVLSYEIPKPQVNSECGAGPMTMSVFENGLVLLFQKAKSTSEKLDFVGWSLSESRDNSKVTTMAGIGIGSTRAELESVYTVEVRESTLGMEFSTVPGGLYGIIDGPSESSKISFMWSGTSCNFR